MRRRLVEATLTVGLSLAVTALVMVAIFPIHPYGRSRPAAANASVVHALLVEPMGASITPVSGVSGCPWIAARAAAAGCPAMRGLSAQTSCPYLRERCELPSCPGFRHPGTRFETDPAGPPPTRGLLLASASPAGSLPDSEG